MKVWHLAALIAALLALPFRRLRMIAITLLLLVSA